MKKSNGLYQRTRGQCEVRAGKRREGKQEGLELERKWPARPLASGWEEGMGTGERRGQEEGEGAGMGSARQHWELEEDADTGQVGNCGAVPRTRSQLGLETMVSLKGSRSAGA